MVIKETKKFSCRKINKIEHTSKKHLIFVFNSFKYLMRASWKKIKQNAIQLKSRNISNPGYGRIYVKFKETILYNTFRKHMYNKRHMRDLLTSGYQKKVTPIWKFLKDFCYSIISDLKKTPPHSLAVIFFGDPTMLLPVIAVPLSFVVFKLVRVLVKKTPNAPLSNIKVVAEKTTSVKTIPVVATYRDFYKYPVTIVDRPAFFCKTYNTENALNLHRKFSPLPLDIKSSRAFPETISVFPGTCNNYNGPVALSPISFAPPFIDGVVISDFSPLADVSEAEANTKSILPFSNPPGVFIPPIFAKHGNSLIETSTVMEETQAFSNTEAIPQAVGMPVSPNSEILASSIMEKEIFVPEPIVVFTGEFVEFSMSKVNSTVYVPQPISTSTTPVSLENLPKNIQDYMFIKRFPWHLRNLFDDNFFEMASNLSEQLEKKIPLDYFYRMILTAVNMKLVASGLHSIPYVLMFHYVGVPVKNLGDIQFIYANSPLLACLLKQDIYSVLSPKIKNLLAPVYCKALSPKSLVHSEEEIATAKTNGIENVTKFTMSPENSKLVTTNYNQSGNTYPDIVRKLNMHGYELEYWDCKNYWLVKLNDKDQMRIVHYYHELAEITYASHEKLRDKIRLLLETEDGKHHKKLEDFLKDIQDNISDYEKTNDGEKFAHCLWQLDTKHKSIIIELKITKNIPQIVCIDDLDRDANKHTEIAFVEEICQEFKINSRAHVIIEKILDLEEKKFSRQDFHRILLLFIKTFHEDFFN